MEKIALVTGASRGIGRAVAAELAHRGWAVAIGYRVRRDKAEELAAALTAEGCRAMICRADVSRREEVEEMVRTVADTFGPVSLLVNNAGIAGQCLFQDLTDERWHEFFSVNVDGAFYTSRAVGRHGVPGPEIGVVDAFLRVSLISEYIPGYGGAVGAIFFGGSRDGLGVSAPIQADNGGILQVVHGLPSPSSLPFTSKDSF